VSADVQHELTHADYVDQVDQLRAAFAIVADLEVAEMRAHHDKLRALGPLDPVAWAKHGKRIQEELYLIALAEDVVAVMARLGSPPDLASAPPA
jgi:hypothetical protein